MLPTLEQYGLERLTVQELIDLLQVIWDSLPIDSHLTDKQRTELEERHAEHQAHPEDCVSWSEIKTTANARWKS